ncbi:MAG: RNA polymerase sigma factor RpoD/SigA [Pseudomonadota bacterium]|nr:RNA polymerase sigma factor RpoD/SigA [Pseudomonadota bacterium]
MIDNTDEKDIELMFAEARRYDLLTAEQEQSIDSTKWSAVREIYALIADNDELSQYLAQFCRECLENPPQIQRFPNRDLHFVLRRELAALFSDGSHADQSRNVAKKLSGLKTSAARLKHVEALELPASLTIGIAVAILRRAGGQFADTVADAIGHWQRHWQTPVPSFALDHALLSSIKKQLRTYTEARDRLVMHNLRLVYSIASRYKGRGVGYLDLVQEGTLGLIRAAEKFEYEKGFRFSTYCFNWITQAVRRYVGDAGTLIRFPTHVQEQIGRLYKERYAEQARTGQEADAETIAANAGMDPDKARELLQLRNLTVSLDAPKFDEDDETLVDGLVGETFGEAGDDAEQASLGNFLGNAIGRLEANERQVVLARWGLQNGPPLSRAEIADKLGVSREWVRQLERSALKKINGQIYVLHAFDVYRLSGNW